MDKLTAECIYLIAEKELAETGKSSIETIQLMKKAVESIGKDFLDYFYPEGNNMIFNLKRWKRHFMEVDGKEGG